MPSLSERLNRQYQLQFGQPATADNPNYAAWIKTALPAMVEDDRRAYERSKNRWNTVGKIATTAVGGILGGVAAPAAVGSIFAGGAPAAAGAATSAAGTGAATAAKAGTMATLGKIFNSKGLDLGVNAALSLIGSKKASNAAEQARQDQLAANREAIALQRQQLEMEARNADLDREDARALNEAINRLKERELAAAEEERAYLRSKDEAREARLAPYREISIDAARALRSLFAGG